MLLTSQPNLPLARSLLVVDASRVEQLRDVRVAGVRDGLAAVQRGVGAALLAVDLLLLWLSGLRSWRRNRHRLRSRSRSRLRDWSRACLDRDGSDNSREEGSRNAGDVEAHDESCNYKRI